MQTATTESNQRNKNKSLLLGVGDDIDVLTSWVATYINELQSMLLEGKDVDSADFNEFKSGCNELGYPLTECMGQMAQQALADHQAENNHVRIIFYCVLKLHFTYRYIVNVLIKFSGIYFRNDAFASCGRHHDIKIQIFCFYNYGQSE